ncbi:MAG: hypothetical protein PVTTEEND_000200 [Candidatus Fervidibacter sp.]|jgi:hypothetical protein
MPKAMTKVKQPKKAAKAKSGAMTITLPQPPTAEAIYEQIVKPLPTPERFKLAQLILSNIPSRAVVDYSEEWTEEDMRDFALATFRYADMVLGEWEE